MIEKLKHSKTIQTEYLGILACITGGLVFIFWFYWIGTQIGKKEGQALGRYSFLLSGSILFFIVAAYISGIFTSYPASLDLLFELLAVLMLIGYFAWNFTFRNRWNQELEKNEERFNCSAFWTFFLGPVYLNFKINQIKGIEQ